MSKSYYIVPIFVPHLGCPHDCVFCNQKRISGVQRPLESDELHKSIENILSTLDYSNNPRVEIAFFGGSFTGISLDVQEKYLSVGRHYIKSGKVSALRLSTRPDYIDDEILERLKCYGVEIIELGVQSMHDKILKASNRGHSVEDVIKASKLIKEKGFQLGIQLMPGLPDDSVEYFKQTINKAIALEPKMLRLYPTLVIEDTELADSYSKGLYEPMAMNDAVEACAYGLEKCLEKGIKVIRIGLQPSETVSDKGAVISGPFHPTFRQLAEGHFFYKKIDEKLKQMGELKEKKLEIKCHNTQVSSVSGMNKRNKIALSQGYGLSRIKIKGCDEIAPYKIVVEVF